MFALLLALTFTLASSQACNFPLSGSGSCTYSTSLVANDFIITFTNDVRFPSCLDVHFTTSSSDNYEFTYNLQNQYNLQWSGNNNLLVSVISGNDLPNDGTLLKPSVFFTMALYSLCVLLGFSTSVKRSVVIIGLLALLPIALLCSPNPSVLTIGVPASLMNAGWRTEIHSNDVVLIFVDDNSLTQCNCGTDCTAILACSPSSSVNTQTCACGTINCPNGCATCSSSSVCLTCLAGYNFTAGQCIASCPSNCATCSSANLCTACISGYVLSAAGQCIRQCPTGCTACTSANTCTSCSSGYTLSSGQCVRQCPTGCSTCSSANVCTACMAGYVLTGSQCVLSNCSTGCSTCSSANVCTACVAGYVLTGSQCVLSNCSTGCSTCSSANVCTACLAAYSLVGNQCFRTCSPLCNSTSHCVEGQCVGTGVLYFSIAWQFAGDGDIYVTDPLGNTISWVQPAIDGGVLDFDDTTGRGPENVYWATNPPAGTYRVCIDDYVGDTADFIIPQTVTYYLNSTTPQYKTITMAVTDLYTSDTTPPNPCTTNSNGYLGSYTV